MTEPIARSPVFTRVNAPIEDADAIVRNALLVLLKVIALSPTKANP